MNYRVNPRKSTIRKVVRAQRFNPDKHPWPTGITKSSSSEYFLSDYSYPIAKINPGDWVLVYLDATKEVLSDPEFHNIYRLAEG